MGWRLPDPAFLTIQGLHEGYANGQFTPEEVLAATYERIARLDARLHAFLTVLPRPQATGPTQPLGGVPLAIKDNTFVAGIRCTAGSKILADYVPDRDAFAVQRLRHAGAELIGKTNLHEFAYGVTTNNPHYGPTRNPWDENRMAGGSSGGSAAALAAGMVPAATGTDTAGSIRIPAALCGVSGLRPTSGRVSKAGVIPLSWTFDTQGPMARTVEDLALLLTAMAGLDPADPLTLGAPPPTDYRKALHGSVQGLRIGVPRRWLGVVERGVLRNFESALARLRELGVVVTDVVVPYEEHFFTAFYVIDLAEASAYHEPWVRTRLHDYGPDVRRRVQLGFPFLATQYLRCQQVRTLATQALPQLFDTMDVLALPSVPLTAPPIDATSVRIDGEAIEVRQALIQLTFPASFLGLPALSVPNGFNGDLPTGLQLIGRYWDEATILRLGHAYQQVTDFHRQRPPL